MEVTPNPFSSIIDNQTSPYNINDAIIGMRQGGMVPISSTDRVDMIDDRLNKLIEAKQKKAESLHMLTDLYFNRKKLTFEECQNLLGMIHSVDEENLVMAELILKNKSKIDAPVCA